MSDHDNVDVGKASAWTDEAKFQFLLRVVAQLKEDGKQINWTKFEMPGRTTKSLQNMWTKVNKQIAELDEIPEGAEAIKKVATPRKRRVKKDPFNEDEEGEAQTPKKTPRKRRSPGPTPKRTPKARKAQEGEDVTAQVKNEEAGEDEEREA